MVRFTGRNAAVLIAQRLADFEREEVPADRIRFFRACLERGWWTEEMIHDALGSVVSPALRSWLVKTLTEFHVPFSTNGGSPAKERRAPNPLVLPSHCCSRETLAKVSIIKAATGALIDDNADFLAWVFRHVGRNPAARFRGLVENPYLVLTEDEWTQLFTAYGFLP